MIYKTIYEKKQTNRKRTFFKFKVIFQKFHSHKEEEKLLYFLYQIALKVSTLLSSELNFL